MEERASGSRKNENEKDTRSAWSVVHSSGREVGEPPVAQGGRGSPDSNSHGSAVEGSKPPAEQQRKRGDSEGSSQSSSEESDEDLLPVKAVEVQNTGVARRPPEGVATRHSGTEGEDDSETAGEDDSEDAKKDSTLLNSKWEDSFQRLLAFKKVHGHCLVPNRYREDPQLGSWVSTQRRQYKLLMSGSGSPSAMTAERARRLEAMGFQWSTTDPRHVPWEQRYGELRNFVERFGHSQVPIGWEENVQLSNWVSTQRQEYKLMQKGRKTRLTRDRIDQLNKLSFVWEAQRGGPRRSKRATVCVPEKPTPVKDRGGAALQALGDVTAAAEPIKAPAPRRPSADLPAGAPAPAHPPFHPPHPPPHRLGHGPSDQRRPDMAPSAHSLAADEARRSATAASLLAQANERARRASVGSSPVMHPSASLNAAAAAAELRAAGLLLNAPGVHNINANLGLGIESSDAGIAAAVARLGNYRANHEIQQAQQAIAQARASQGLLDAGLTQPGSQWQLLPHGGFQHQPDSLLSRLGIFPIATPSPIVASGYQLGMIPNSLVPGEGQILPPAPVPAPGAQEPPIRPNRKRRKKHKKRKRKSRRRDHERSEDEDHSNDSSDSSSDSDDGEAAG